MLKPDFMMYYDACNTTAKVNKWANNIAALLPECQKQRRPSPIGDKGYRGACILVYCPTNMCSRNDIRMNRASQGLKFSIDDMQKIIKFHDTDDADKMYKRHDIERSVMKVNTLVFDHPTAFNLPDGEPMHRMFGSE